MIEINKDSNYQNLQFVSWIDIGIRIDSVCHAVVGSLGEERVVRIEHLSWDYQEPKNNDSNSALIKTGSPFSQQASSILPLFVVENDVELALPVFGLLSMKFSKRVVEDRLSIDVDRCISSRRVLFDLIEFFSEVAALDVEV